MTGGGGVLPDAGLEALLDGDIPPGVLFWTGTGPAEAVLGRARERGWQAAAVDLGGVTDRHGLFERFSSGLRLPDWFGANWDALADCLTDLSWWRSRRREPQARHGRLVLLEGWQGFAGSAPADWEVAREVLASAVDYWSRTPDPLVVLLRKGIAADP